MSEAATPRLINVGCEACHGQGEEHSRVESGSDEKLQEKLRLAIRLPIEGDTAKKHCLTCHDGNNSPHFDFDTYWKKIEHKEEEL